MSFPLTMPALVYASGNRLISLSPPDILIIVLYFLAVLGIGFYLRSFANIRLFPACREEALIRDSGQWFLC